jgi:hypothetical protein
MKGLIGEPRNMDDMLRRSERIIDGSVRKFLDKGRTYEELAQEGRFLVWDTIMVNFIVDDTFDAFRNLIRNELESGLDAFVRRVKRKRRAVIPFREPPQKAVVEDLDKADNSLSEKVPEEEKVVTNDPEPVPEPGVVAIEQNENSKIEVVEVAPADSEEPQIIPEPVEVEIDGQLALITRKKKRTKKPVPKPRGSNDNAQTEFTNNALIDLGVNRFNLDAARMTAMETRDNEDIKAVIHLLVHLTCANIEDAPKVVNYDTFVKFGLQYFLWIFFSNSPYRALAMAYPDLRPEDMKRRPNGYWQQPDSIEKALKDLRVLLISSGYLEESIPLVVNDRFLVDHGLRTPLNKFWNGSPFAFLDAAFPGRYMPWQMSVTPIHCFADRQQVIKAVKWLVEEVMEIDVSNMNKREIWRYKVDKKITKDKFEDNGLRGLLNRFDNSPERIIRFVYPKKFFEWSFPGKDKWSRGEASLKLAAKATIWVIEKYAKIEPSPNIKYKFFVENGLHGMITSKKLGFNSSPKAALKNAYPEMKFEQTPSK